MKGRDLIRFVGFSLMFKVCDLATYAAFDWPVDNDRSAVIAGFITLLYAIRDPRP